MSPCPWTLNCLLFISAFSSIHLIISVYGRILGLAAIRWRNEHASSSKDASEERCEPVTAATFIILGLSSSSSLYMLSHVDIPASLLQAVSVYKGAISFVFSLALELWALFFFPISSCVCVWIVLALRSCRLWVKCKWLIQKGDGRVLNAADVSNMPPYVK